MILTGQLEPAVIVAVRSNRMLKAKHQMVVGSYILAVIGGYFIFVCWLVAVAVVIVVVVVLCCGMLWYVVLCCVMLCCVVL